MNKITKVIKNPALIREVPDYLFSNYARMVVGKQLHSRASLLDTSGINRDHYDWTEESGQFAWDIFCIQQTNLINFVKIVATGNYQVAVEIGATSDMFLRHVKAERKIGINVLDSCIEQLNRQGIEGIKTDGQHIPLADREADLVICFETLEHVRNPLSFLTELGRIAKRQVLLSIPWVAKTNIRDAMLGYEGEHHIFEFSELDFRKILGYTDFKVSEYRKLINYGPRYGPFTNWCLRKYVYPSYFPAIQVYILELDAHRE